MARFCYIAYPTSLRLQSANAIQTWSTLRALRQIGADPLVLIARWQGGASRFEEVGAIHLPRPAIGRLSRFYRSTLWYYAERSVFAAMTAAVVAEHQRRGERFAAVYVRELICAAWWVGVWGPLLGIPVVYEAHDLESWNPSRAKERWAQPLLHLADRVALSRAAHVTSLTAEFRTLLVRLGWQRAERISVVPDAYDPAHYYPRDRAACRAELGIPAEARLIVYSGLTFAYRSLDLLVDAVAALAPADPHLRLALVGGRPAEVAALQAQAARLGIADRLICTGQIAQERTPLYLGAADLLAIPDTVTHITASPLKLFEYMAAQRAIVLPGIAALREIVPEDAGFFFARGDLVGLTAALAGALADPDERTRRAARAADVVLTHTYEARARRIVAAVSDVSSISHNESGRGSSNDAIVSKP